MSSGQDVGWYAVRCVFSHPTAEDPSAEQESSGAAYEERITLWRATSGAEAIARAEVEAQEYVADLGEESEYLGLAQAYQLDDDPVDRAEVFSLMRESELSPKEYLETFFSTGSELAEDV